MVLTFLQSGNGRVWNEPYDSVKNHAIPVESWGHAGTACGGQLRINGDLEKWSLGLIQTDENLKEEGPGFVRGMQTRDRGVR
jgi:hypothetical protein